MVLQMYTKLSGGKMYTKSSGGKAGGAIVQMPSIGRDKRHACFVSLGAGSFDIIADCKDS